MLAERGADRRGRVRRTGVDLELDKPRDLLLLGRHCSLRVLVRVNRLHPINRMEAYRTTITGIAVRLKTEQVRGAARASLTCSEVLVPESAGGLGR
ncbi:hypothetical protein GCM10010388_30430 [Streptomyces mauvecolor]